MGTLSRKLGASPNVSANSSTAGGCRAKSHITIEGEGIFPSAVCDFAYGRSRGPLSSSRGREILPAKLEFEHDCSVRGVRGPGVGSSPGCSHHISGLLLAPLGPSDRLTTALNPSCDGCDPCPQDPQERSKLVNAMKRQIRVLFILLSALLLGTATYSIVIPDRAIAGCGGRC